MTDRKSLESILSNPASSPEQKARARAALWNLPIDPPKPGSERAPLSTAAKLMLSAVGKTCLADVTAAEFNDYITHNHHLHGGPLCDEFAAAKIAELLDPEWRTKRRAKGKP